ncbi:MAG: hypothetical protein SFY69_12675 [Planctomycetota bacterium]|nr:hypothetical protein [Planctomycetota bacterium]
MFTGSGAGLQNLSAANVTSGTLPLSRGGTGANLSQTGGTGRFLKQLGAGAPVTVAPILSSELPAFGGDVTGQINALTVNGLRGVSVSSTPPSDNQALVFQGVWTPTTLAVGGDVAGALSTTTVVGLRGRPVSPTAPLTGQTLVWSGAAWTPSTVTLAGDVTGVAGATTVDRLQGRALASTAPTTNQVIAWNGSAWAPANGVRAPAGKTRIIFGVYTSAQTSGPGYSVSNPSTGVYTITFSPQFAGPPTVVATAVAGVGSRNAGVGAAPSATTATVQTHDNVTDALESSIWYFIAVGPD